MIALRIEFVAGQFHANPWDRGTNQDEIEWPPSPWRLLRAIVVGWHRSGREEDETLLRVLDALSEPPSFDLPIASSGHSRHCAPQLDTLGISGLESGKPERTLMLDSFIALEDRRAHGTDAFAIWPNAELDSIERALLERCCRGVRYLGRAESPCQVSVLDNIHSAPERYRVDRASLDVGEGPLVRRLAPGPALHGAGLLRALNAELGLGMRRARTTMPPSTTWVDYRLPSDFGWVREQALQRDVQRNAFPPTVLRFALDAENGVLPPITDAVAVAEKMRQAAIKHHSAVSGSPASKRLAGKRADGSDRREGHDHPFFLPLDLRGRGVIDGIDVWLPEGCTHDEFRALTSVSYIWDRFVLEGRFAVRYLGRVERFTAMRWSTVTPVVLDRFPKHRGPGGTIAVDAADEQVRRALERRGLPPAEVEVWNPRQAITHRFGGQTRLDAFRRARIGERTHHPVVGATIRFDAPVIGPIIVGRLAHFGLGRFEPV